MPSAEARLKSGARVALGEEPLLRERSVDKKIPRPSGLLKGIGAGVEPGLRLSRLRISRSLSPTPTLNLRGLRTMRLTFG